MDANHAAYSWQAYGCSSHLYRTNFTFLTSNMLWGGTYFLPLLIQQIIPISVITAIGSSPHSYISKVPYYQSEYCLQLQREVERGKQQKVKRIFWFKSARSKTIISTDPVCLVIYEAACLLHLCLMRGGLRTCFPSSQQPKKSLLCVPIWQSIGLICESTTTWAFKKDNIDYPQS